MTKPNKSRDDLICAVLVAGVVSAVVYVIGGSLGLGESLAIGLGVASGLTAGIMVKRMSK